MVGYIFDEKLYKIPILEYPEDFALWREVIEDYLTSLGLWKEMADPDLIPSKPDLPPSSIFKPSAMMTGYRSFGSNLSPTTVQSERLERYRKDSKDFWDWKARNARARMIIRSTVSEDLNCQLPGGTASDMYTFICDFFDTDTDTAANDSA